ncbi:MAG: bifunctional phosphopantothenoylcysteine decarboxylase/phosphopantothenate--cysteine ligase CoaBC [Gammaproteobacteria bacterium]
MNVLAHKRILLGVTGGVAAYKSAELVRRLREHEAEVRVVVTRSASLFIGPLTLEALSGERVYSGLFDPASPSAMPHIDLARWCDAVLIAPASAHLIAKLAHGLADDLLSTLCLAATVPIVVAPAMNREMWLAPSTQTNRALLLERGVRFLGPGEGEQACGELGPGRMLEVPEVLEGLATVFERALLSGVRVLVTAGPTREALDPVRFLGNRSSGKMGYALAEAMREMGGSVLLISGPVHLPAPRGVERVMVESAAEMAAAVTSRVVDCEIFVATAAVADYRCRVPADHKIRRTGEPLTLELEPTPDILAAVAARPAAPFTVGFAAETEGIDGGLADLAGRKLAVKGIDMIVANRVGEPGQGFESDDNELLVSWHAGERFLPRAPKSRLARQLVPIIAERFRAKGQAQGLGSTSRA